MQKETKIRKQPILQMENTNDEGDTMKCQRCNMHNDNPDNFETIYGYIFCCECANIARDEK